MDKNSLYKLIQSFFVSGTTVIVGSGLSCAEGLPGMWALSQELLKEIPKLIGKCDEWLLIAEELEADKGLEETLLKYKPNDTIEAAIKKVTTCFIESSENDVIQKVIAGETTLRITNLIEKLPFDNQGLNIITTNYDRLIEVGCSVNGVGIDTMFVGSPVAILDENESRMSFCRDIKKTGREFKLNYAKRIKLYKPHGCLSWRMMNAIPVSTSLHIEGDRLIITPGLNKFRAGYEQPFDIHREKANNAIDTASKFIVIGYGFNDDHLETHLDSQIKSGKPVLILTRGLTENTIKVIQENKNVYAIYHESNGTRFTSSDVDEIFDDINIWDVRELCKEVF